MLPPLLLVAVAIAQIVATRTTPISPWLGGGFGMFATLDAPSRRHLHAVALRLGLREEIEVPRWLDPELRRALGFPSEHRLRVLAAELEAFVRANEDPGAGPLEAISLGVYGVRYDRDTLAPSGVPIASLEVPVGPE